MCIIKNHEVTRREKRQERLATSPTLVLCEWSNWKATGVTMQTKRCYCTTLGLTAKSARRTSTDLQN